MSMYNVLQFIEHILNLYVRSKLPKTPLLLFVTVIFYRVISMVFAVYIFVKTFYDNKIYVNNVLLLQK